MEVDQDNQIQTVLILCDPDFCLFRNISNP